LLRAGVALFAAASLLSALAPSFWLLIGCRVLQGFGAAAMIATAIGTIGDLFPPETRGRPLGIHAAVTAVTQVAAPVVGGALLTRGGGRPFFRLARPLGVIALLLPAAFLRARPRPEGAGQPRFDYLGALLVAAGVACLFATMERLLALLLDPLTELLLPTG